MIRLVRRHVRDRSQGDDGIALVVAIALIAVVGMLIAAMVAVAMYESRSTGRDRQRSQAVMAAEQQVDALMAQIQGSPVAAVPCGALPAAAVSVASDQLTVNSTVRYFAQNDAPLTDCAAIRSGATRAYRAAITATATSAAIQNQAPASRTVEMLVSLEPEFANDMTKAIFGDGGVDLANQADIYGTNGQPNADVYTNGNVDCNNNQKYHGSIYAQGYVRMTNTCWVAVDVYANNYFRADNAGVTVNGRVLVSNGYATMANNVSIGGQVMASTTVTGPTVCSQPNKCFPNSVVPPVPHQDFPVLDASDAAIDEWQAPPPDGGGFGLTVVEFSPALGNCTGSIPNPYNGKADWVGYQVALLAPTLTGPTIVRSDCPQQMLFQGLDLTLNNHLLLFSDSGFKFTNTMRVASTTSQSRNLYLIQPHDTMYTCSGDGIALENQVTVKPEVDVLLYSPCDVRKANNTTHYGQIYAGGVAEIHNKLTMFYKPLPVFGVTSSSTVESYTLEIDYKRENL